MTQALPLTCDSCVHRITETSCAAFDAIPERIVVWGESHNMPDPDQANSVVWEFAPGTEREFESWRITQELPAR